MRKPKLAVVGASHFQLPLILKAQEMGCEVHAFAWECGDVGESAADVFHPVSIVEVERVVEECRRVGIDGICTIASDLSTITVNRTAHELGLVGNTLECTRLSTNKSFMRRAFALGGDPSPKSVLVSIDDVNEAVLQELGDAVECVHLTEKELEGFDPLEHGLAYPLIVKPVDRSGSRGVTKLEGPDGVSVSDALKLAFDQGFSKSALVEEFALGDEFSVEGMSWQGEHNILAITRKATTDAPHFIESAHLEPAFLSEEVAAAVKKTVLHALDTLGVTYGASHSELKIAPDGTMRLIEIGARMGGDCIGSNLVPLYTGIDYVRAVVDVALGNKPDLEPKGPSRAAAIRFLFDEEDFRVLDRLRVERPDLICAEWFDSDEDTMSRVVSDSSTRRGHFIMAADDACEFAPYLPASMARAAGLLR